jgi:hypothetical protein
MSAVLDLKLIFGLGNSSIRSKGPDGPGIARVRGTPTTGHFNPIYLLAS